MKHVILKVSEVERTMIVAAVMAYIGHLPAGVDLAGRLSQGDDAADDGPEVAILNSEPPATVTFHDFKHHVVVRGGLSD